MSQPVNTTIYINNNSTASVPPSSPPSPAGSSSITLSSDQEETLQNFLQSVIIRTRLADAVKKHSTYCDALLKARTSLEKSQSLSPESLPNGLIWNLSKNINIPIPKGQPEFAKKYLDEIKLLEMDSAKKANMILMRYREKYIKSYLEPLADENTFIETELQDFKSFVTQHATLTNSIRNASNNSDRAFPLEHVQQRFHTQLSSALLTSAQDRAFHLTSVKQQMDKIKESKQQAAEKVLGGNPRDTIQQIAAKENAPLKQHIR